MAENGLSLIPEPPVSSVGLNGDQIPPRSDPPNASPASDYGHRTMNPTRAPGEVDATRHD